MIPSRTLGEVLGGLPGVRPRSAREPAESVLREAGLIDQPREVLYPATELREGAYGPYLVLYPAAARCLAQAYAAGKLPMTPGASLSGPAEWLVHFAALTDSDLADLEAQQPLSFEVLEDAYWRWVRRACPHASHTPAARSWCQDAEFIHRGVAYERTRTVMRSNSGKSVVGGETQFLGADGSLFESAPLARNRRNDPERNWGLGPE